jgi:hypothetical protein
MKQLLLFLLGTLFTMSSQGQVPVTNLVKSYLFTGGSLQNTVTPGTKDAVKTGTASTLVTSNYLIANDALSLNGDYLSGGTSAGSINLSVSFWIKTSTNDATQRYLFSQFNATPGFGVKCYLLNGRVVFGGSYKQSAVASAFNTVTSINSLADGKWHHITARADKITTNPVIGVSPENWYRYHLFVDGVSQGQINNAPTIYVISLLDTTTPFMVGIDNSLAGAKYQDALDDIRYYERSLSDTEIHNLYFDNIPEGVVYVNKSATGNNDGTSWANAYTNLQSAFTNYISKNTIWVAAGRYTPHATDRKGTFSIPDAAKLYGGFNGTETLLTQRDPKTNITNLSGDLFGNDNSSIVVTEATRQDNAYHVISLKGNVQNIIVDGFTISGGNAGGGNAITCATAAASQYHDQRGAAVYANPYVEGQNITAKFRNCIIEKNTAYNIGVYSPFSPCGVENVSTDVDFESCIVRDNRTRDLSAMLFSGNSAFGIFSKGSIVNSLFYNNTSDNGSSCVYLTASTSSGGTLTGIEVQIINSTFANNTGLSGNVMTMSVAANTVIRNSIIYGNGSATPFAITTTGSVVNNSIVEGGQQGGANTNPLYKNAGARDYSLSCSSPAINSGNNAYITLTTDLAGKPRNASTVDLGAYEFQPLSSITALSRNITVQLNASGSATITPEQVDNGSGAACGIAFTLSLSKTSFSCADVGANVVTLTATETVSGAQSTAQATVTIIDNMAPTVVTQNITVQLNAAGIATITPAAINNGSTDNCTIGGSLGLALSKTTFDCSNLGAYTVTLTVTDAANNQATATAIVTVVDNISPTALAQNITVQLNASGSATIAAASINNGSTDNCTASGALVKGLSKSTFTCADLGANTVTLTVTDATGNQSTATATVTVEDKLAPTAIAKNITINLDNSGSASITAADINNGSADNCTSTANLILSINTSSFTTANLGANSVTLTVQDAQGNSSTATATVTVQNKTNQTISFPAISNKIYTDPNFNVTASASSGLAVSYSVVSGPAAISGNTVTITGAGNVTIEATQGGDANFAVAPSVQQSFTVNPALLTVTAANNTMTYGNALPALSFTYTGFKAGETVSVLTSQPTIATTANVSSDAGNYSITVSGGSDENYTFEYVPGTLTINKANQTISIGAIANKIIRDNAFSVVASTTSGLTLSYNISGPATILGNTVTLTGTAGTVTITASQAGNINYNSASQSVSFEVIDPRQAQTISFGAIEDQILEVDQLLLQATASSGLPVTFELVSGPATISGQEVSFIGLGTVVIRAKQSGNDDFHAATSVEQSFDVITITGLEGQVTGLHIYPNPTADYFQIDIPKNEKAHISLLSMDGKEMMKVNPGERIDISTLRKGIYLIRIVISDRVTTRQIIKN